MFAGSFGTTILEAFNVAVPFCLLECRLGTGLKIFAVTVVPCLAYFVLLATRHICDGSFSASYVTVSFIFFVFWPLELMQI